MNNHSLSVFFQAGDVFSWNKNHRNTVVTTLPGSEAAAFSTSFPSVTVHTQDLASLIFFIASSRTFLCKTELLVLYEQFNDRCHNFTGTAIIPTKVPVAIFTPTNYASSVQTPMQFKSNWWDQEWWHISISPALERLRQGGHKFEDNLDYTVSSKQLGYKILSQKKEKVKVHGILNLWNTFDFGSSYI